MSSHREFDQTKSYQIRIKGTLSKNWSDWFEGFTITPLDNDETMLAGSAVDQIALHGMLSRIRDLGLSLITVTQINERTSENDSNCYPP